MKGLLWLFVLAALAVALSLVLRAGGGYALFVLPPWRAEVSLNFLAILAVVGFGLLYLLVRAFWHTLRLPSHVRAFRRRRKEEAGHEATLGAIQALFEGRFVRAEKLASKAIDLGAAPGLAGLLGARAAQRLRDFARRDRWLEQSRQGGGDWHVAQAMTRAELLLDERRYDEARSVLRELHASGPKHVAGLFLMLRAEQGLANPEEVLRIASALEKHDAMPPEALDSIRVNARVALLSRAPQDTHGLQRQWDATPRSDRVRPKVAATAARAFIQLGDCRRAHRIIEDALDRGWDATLALLYGECVDRDALERLERAEKWLKERPDETELLLTLGRLCVQRELWGKAQSYLEASLATRPTREAHIALARLHERLGRSVDAARHFRASADLSQGAPG